MRIKTGLGQDSHRFDFDNPMKRLILGGVIFEEGPPLQGNSDADVVLHALCNGISGITGVNILGAISDALCLKHGITDSRFYVQEALNYLKDWRISHVSFSIECKVPKITPKMPEMKATISELLGLEIQDIGITATTGEGLTDFGRGEGIQVLCIVTAINDV
jgi:2-C-methyl-D-erythritol 2,4-cyclodiphosphate synthase